MLPGADAVTSRDVSRSLLLFSTKHWSPQEDARCLSSPRTVVLLPAAHHKILKARFYGLFFF